MFELGIMLAFTAVLMVCIISGMSIVYALFIGYFIFCFYGLKKGHTAGALFQMSLSGVKTIKNILIVFLLIGMITALWRASGTIPVILVYSARLVHPAAFLVITFLLNCLVSFLIGTSFGTSATMGVICMAMASAMGIDPLYVGGAVVSGIYFGDRCSPVSSSALLVSELTGTDIYENIKRMAVTSAVPFFLTCVVYGILGLLSGGSGELMDVEALFSGSFKLHWILSLPALAILVLSAFRIPVKKTMAVSIILSAVFGMTIQKIPPAELAKTLVWGFQAEDAGLAAMLNGGGILSMVRVTVIVGLSSCYAGIFEGTGLLLSMKRYIASLGKRITPFGSLILVSAVTSMISCNQTLSTMLTYQLCRELEPDHQKMAIHLENTVIVMAPLVPWSIAGAVPIATIAAPMASLFLACYLYLVPAWNFFVQLWKAKA